MNAIVPRVAHAFGLAFVLCIAGGADAIAQPTQSAPAIADTFIAVVPLRSLQDIKVDGERAGALRNQAKQRLAQAQEGVHTLDNVIKARQTDLAALESHVDTLDADSKANEIATLKQKTALLEKLLDLLELRKNAREGEVESAAATVEYSEAQEELYSLEGQLATKRNDRAELSKKKGSPADLAAMDLAIKEMESEVMERWDQMLTKHDDSVSEEQDYVGLLKKLAEAQDSFHTP